MTKCKVDTNQFLVFLIYLDAFFRELKIHPFDNKFEKQRTKLPRVEIKVKLSSKLTNLENDDVAKYITYKKRMHLHNNH